VETADESQRVTKWLGNIVLGLTYNGKLLTSRERILCRSLRVNDVVIHTSMLFFQVVTLNVAVNSYSNALLSLLMSNQFVEIKGTVFKKFEKENLFQMACAGTSSTPLQLSPPSPLPSPNPVLRPPCALHIVCADSDIVERFHLSLLLTLILIRNFIEHTNSLTTPLKLPWMDLCMPFIMVLGSELMVDWCKHAFVTKFNHIRPSIYERFMDVLCLDFVKDGREVLLPFLPALSPPLSIRTLGSHSRFLMEVPNDRHSWIRVPRCQEEWDYLPSH
jgi:Eukaryotic membrane protein family